MVLLWPSQEVFIMKVSDFPKHLKKARNRIGLSQADAAELLGLSVRQFQKIEELNHVPKALPFVRGCNLIGISPSEFANDMDDDEEKEDDTNDTVSRR